MDEIDLVKGVSINFWLEMGMALSLIGFGYIVGKLKKQLKMKYINISWDKHSKIHELLTEARVNSDAARAQIIQFHNGEYFMDGISMKKMSLTHESLSKGVSQEADKMNNILISLFTPLMEKIIQNKAEVHKTQDDDPGITKNLMQSNNTVAYAALPIRYRNNITGYIILNWCSENKTKRINNDDISTILTEARDYTEIYLRDILHSEK